MPSKLCKNSHMTVSNFLCFKLVLDKYLWPPQAVNCFHNNSVQMPWQADSLFFLQHAGAYKTLRVGCKADSISRVLTLVDSIQ